MFEVILETIISTLAETFVGRAIDKSRAKNARLWGWINLIVLIVIILGLTALGIYLCISEAVWIGVLMFAIAAFILYITVLFIVRSVKNRLKKD